MKIADYVRIIYKSGPEKDIPIIGKIIKYMEYDLDGGGYVVQTETGDEHYVLFHDVWRGDVILENM